MLLNKKDRRALVRAAFRNLGGRNIRWESRIDGLCFASWSENQMTARLTVTPFLLFLARAKLVVFAHGEVQLPDGRRVLSEGIEIMSVSCLFAGWERNVRLFHELADEASAKAKTRIFTGLGINDDNYSDDKEV